MSFGKIFESTYTGSMVGSGPVVFAVWGYVIANTRPPGLVEINPIILGTILGAPVEDIEQAIGYLESPDPKSRTPDEDGRRLIRVGQFLYKVPTWQKYRESRNDDERRAYNAEAARRSRNKRKESIQASMTINDKSASSAQAEAEAEAEAYRERDIPRTSNRPTLDQAKSAASNIGVSPEMADEWWHAREATDWVKGTAAGGSVRVGANWQADLKTYASRMSQAPKRMADGKPDHRAEKRAREFPEPRKRLPLL